MLTLALALLVGPAVALAAAPPERARLAFVGDVNFLGLDAVDGIFDRVRPLLDDADHTVGNLEGLLLERPVDAYKNPRINITTHARYAAALPGSGLDAVGLANNHTWDHGAEGLLEHLGHLDAQRVLYFGAGRDDTSARAAYHVTLPVGCVAIVPATLKSNKRTPATDRVFAATYASDDLAPLLARLRAERDRGCLVIASVHAGKERAPLPTRGVRRAFRTLAEVADVVVGHHPHVLEGFERVGDAWIAYSLGNFLFVNRDADKRRTGVLQIELERGPTGGRPRVTGLWLAPVTIDARTFLPRPATDAEAQETARLLTDRSRPFGVGTTLVGGRIRIEPAR